MYLLLCVYVYVGKCIPSSLVYECVRVPACALAWRICARARLCTCEQRSTSRARRRASFSSIATTSWFEVHQIYAGLLNAREAPTPVCGFHGGRGASDDFGPANQTIPSSNNVPFAAPFDLVLRDRRCSAATLNLAPRRCFCARNKILRRHLSGLFTRTVDFLSCDT